jgi:outer membrane murein-binding lipoprotein Lpp
MKTLIAAAVSACIALTGCATASKDIAATYVSPMQYQAYDCQQLSSEIQRIQSRVVQLGGRLDTAASNDKAIAGVGIILFWPALFALGGTKQQEADYSRLRGEYDATEQAAILKKCPGAVGVPATVTAAT